MRLLFIVIAWGTASLLCAGLELDQKPLEIFPKPADEVAESDFTFTNKGDRVIRVTGLESSCSCLEASLDKAVYQPGEKGRGKAKFKVSSFTGKHEKLLHIYTDDPVNPDVVLTAVIDIPAIVEVEPKLLTWLIGEKPVPKDFTVKMVGKDPIRITEVNSTRQSVGVSFKEIIRGKEYRITVTPTATADIIIGAVTIKTDSEIPKYQRQMAFFNIVRPEQAEKQRQAEESEKPEAKK